MLYLLLPLKSKIVRLILQKINSSELLLNILYEFIKLYSLAVKTKELQHIKEKGQNQQQATFYNV